MKKLHFFKPTVSDTLATPEEFRNITLDSPAMHVFTDLKMKTPMVLNACGSAVSAKVAIQHSPDKTRLVIDGHGSFVGIVTAAELTDIQIVRMISQGHDRMDIQVSEMMIHRNKLNAFDISELENATIEDVVFALKESGQHHCLVVDRETHEIRGVLSADAIAKKLEKPVNIQDHSSFYKVFSATAH